MENFQGLMLKLAETHQQAPLAPAARTQLQNRLNQILTQYKTPDHPPYSAMIERALHELNEKGGSSEESISQFLEKEHSELPWAHSTLLKHHLGKLCESGDIVLTLGKRYMLAGENPSLDSSSKSRRKPSHKRKSKWRRDGKRNKQKGDRVTVAEICREYDVQEQQLTENGVNGQDKPVKEDQAKILLSCDDGEYGVNANPRFFPTEQKQKQEKEQAADELPELATPERPPGFESVIVENLSNGVDGTNDCYLQEQGTMTSIEVGTSFKSEDHHSLQLELSNVLTPQHQQNTPELTPITEQQQQQEEKPSELLNEEVLSKTKDQGIRIYNRRGKAKSQQPQDVDVKLEQLAELPNMNLLEPSTTIDTSNPSLTSKFEDAKDEKSTNSLRPEHQRKVYRLRSRATKLKPDAEVSTSSTPSACQKTTEPNQDESPHHLEVPQSPKCKRRGRPLRRKLDETVVENFTFVDQQSRQDLGQPDKRACSGKVEAVKTEEEQLKPRRRGRPPKRHR